MIVIHCQDSWSTIVVMIAGYRIKLHKLDMHSPNIYVGEILRRGMQNLSYIYGNAYIGIAYTYAIVFSPTI